MMNITYQGRDNYWQMIRGILIVTVVLIHCTSGRFFAEDSINFNEWIVLRNLIDFPVAIFIFLAGYFAKPSITKNRFFKLTIPFFMWSFIYYLIDVVGNSGDLNLLRLGVKILTGNAAAQLYFILVLLQLTLLTPYLVNWIKVKRYNFLLLCVTPIYMVALYAFVYVEGRQLFFYQTPFLAWFIFYYCGLYCKIHGVANNSFWIKYAGRLCAITLTLEIVESYILLNLGWPKSFLVSQIRFSSFAYVISIIGFLFKCKNIEYHNKWSSYIGDRSYGIYFVHIFWLLVLQYIFKNINININSLIFLNFIELGFALIMSLMSIELCRSINESTMKRYFGF